MSRSPSPSMSASAGPADNGLEDVAADLLGGGEDEGPGLAGRVPIKLGRLGIAFVGGELADFRLEVAIGHQQILIAVKVIVEKRKAEFHRLDTGVAEVVNNGVISEKRASAGPGRADIKRHHLLRWCSDRDGHRVVVGEPGIINPHRTAGKAVGIERHPVLHADFFKCAVAFVVKDKILHRIVSDNEIDQPVVIDVDARNARELCRRVRRCPCCESVSRQSWIHQRNGRPIVVIKPAEGALVGIKAR